MTVALAALFFFKQKAAYEIRLSLVGSEMCIRASIGRTTYQKALQDLLSTIAVYAAQRGAF